MPSRFLSTEEKQQIFHTELVKCHIPYDQAAQVARILASEQLDEQLTPEEQQLVESVCRKWMQQRQRMSHLSQIMATALREKEKEDRKQGTGVRQ